MKNTKLFVLGILLICLVAFAWKFWSILMLFLSSALVAYLLSPIVSTISKRAKIRRGLAVAVVALMFICLVTIFISVTVPTLAGQISSLIAEINRLSPIIANKATELLTWFDSLELPDTMGTVVKNFLAGSDKLIGSFLNSLVNSLFGLTTHIMDGVVFIILVIYFLLDGEMLMGKAFDALPPKLHPKAKAIMNKADQITWKYIKSKIIISFFMALATYIGFVILRVPYATVFAIFAFVLNFIPYFGSLIAGVLPVVVCLFTSGITQAIGVLVLILVIQQIEGNIVSPKIQGDISGIHPITVLFAILACNAIWGPVGMLIAVPVAAVFKMCFIELYEYVISDYKEPTVSEPAQSEPPPIEAVIKKNKKK